MVWLIKKGDGAKISVQLLKLIRNLYLYLIHTVCFLHDVSYVSWAFCAAGIHTIKNVITNEQC